MKKLILTCIALVLMLALVACQDGIINTETKITDANGAGTKTISVKILRDGAMKLDGSAAVAKNGAHLPNGPEAVVDTLKEVCALDDAVIELSESTDEYDVITVSYEWANIDEYNEKTATLANGVADVQPAELTVDGDKVTFTESTANVKNSIQWALEAVYNDPEAYDPKGGDPSADDVKLEEYAQLYDAVVIVGDASGLVDFDKARADKVDVDETISVTGTISAAGEEPADETDEPSEAPQTGDNGVLIFGMGMLIASAALFGFRKKIFN